MEILYGGEGRAAARLARRSARALLAVLGCCILLACGGEKSDDGGNSPDGHRLSLSLPATGECRGRIASSDGEVLHEFKGADALDLVEPLETHLGSADRRLVRLSIMSTSARRWGSLVPLLRVLEESLGEGCAVQISVAALGPRAPALEVRWRHMKRCPLTLKLNMIESVGAEGRRQLLRVTAGSTEIDVPRVDLVPSRVAAVTGHLQRIRRPLQDQQGYCLRVFSGTDVPVTVSEVAVVLVALRELSPSSQLSLVSSAPTGGDPQVISEYELKSEGGGK